MLGRAISKNSLVLGLFAVITTAAIAATYLGTRDLIAEQERAAQAKALLEIVPASRHDNSMLDDVVPVADKALLSLPQANQIHVAMQNGQAVAFIIPAVAPDGYGGALKLVTGVNADGSIAGVRVLSHNETPGLGDKVDLKKSKWVLGFDGKSLQNPSPERWKVKKDRGEFDQFTGATITPRAVTKAVYQSLLYFEANKKALMQYPGPDTTPAQIEEQNNG
jgi:electron transport complex protein RnfG